LFFYPFVKGQNNTHWIVVFKLQIKSLLLIFSRLFFMIRSHFVGLFLFIICFDTSAQVVQWASKVIQFSSEISPTQYSAQQALGKPNVLPVGGESPNAWVPAKSNRKEFLKLGFDNPIRVKQIAIAESYNPSALSRILAYDATNIEHVVYTFNPRAVPLKGRMLNIFMEATPYKVAALKLEFDGAAVPDFYGIDAVAITDSEYPIIADIPIASYLAAGIVVEKLDQNVNSDYSEYNPLLSPDGKTLYFSRKNHPENIGGVKDKEDIWYSEMDENGKWTLAKNMGSQFNNAYPNFANTISTTPDGKSVIMILGNKYVKDGKKSMAGVSISSNVGGKWTDPVNLNIKNDYNLNEKANYFLANNRQALLMSVQRDDSRGDRDLYVTFLETDSVWTEPLNLGNTINTAAEESGPFLAIDDKTLYFSSKGFSGYGGSDIYVSKRLDDTWTNWSPPENMGSTINSAMEDLFFNIPANSEFAYYSKGVTEDNTDIYSVKLPFIKSPEPWVAVTGKLIDAKTDQPLGAKIIYERLPDGKAMGLSQSDPKTGEFEVKLPAGSIYSFRSEAKDHLSESQNIDLRNVSSEKGDNKMRVDFRLKPIASVAIEKNAVFTLNSIFFDFDKAILKPESFPELNRIVQFMNENPTVTIEIAGHTDNVGKKEYNQNLSERRANAVKKFLTSKGLHTSRTTALGFGETRPVASNDDEKDGREVNRRVEFKITNM
jgi:outer membrane protein OmpA-like peptidoglycan-associated protein